MLFAIEMQPTLISRVIEAQGYDKESNAYRLHITSDHGLDRWTITEDGGLRF